MSTDIYAGPPSRCSFIEPHSDVADKLAACAKQGIDIEQSDQAIARSEVAGIPHWRRFREVDSELWLDSGDIEVIESLWNAEFSGLTTNNTLLNKEVQKGVYDDLIPEVNKLLQAAEDVDDHLRLREIGFVLNVRHALRLVSRFQCQVSVELHTDLAHDLEATLAYARRCHAICPRFFVVKVPFTPSGLMASKRLGEEGVRVNCTLGFSARQNYLITAFGGPAYVNVFLGRLNAYVAENNLGTGEMVGEKATLASQQEVSIFSRGLPTNNTRQIAASLRDADQVNRLAGVDVLTMPPAVAREVPEKLEPDTIDSHLNDELEIALHQDLDLSEVQLEKLWNVSGKERDFAQKLILDAPDSPGELVRAARRHNLFDLFPEFTDEDLKTIAGDGKIPRHETWKHRIHEETLAIDCLLNAAGLASFAASQADLDDHIRASV